MIGAQTKLNRYFTVDSEFVNSFNKELIYNKLLKWDSYAYTSISLPTYFTRIFFYAKHNEDQSNRKDWSCNYRVWSLTKLVATGWF